MTSAKKTCTVCGKTKSLQEFSRAGSKGYLRGDCKTCETARKKEIYQQRKQSNYAPRPRFASKQKVAVYDEETQTLYVCQVLSGVVRPKRLHEILLVLNRGGVFSLNGRVFHVEQETV